MLQNLNSTSKNLNSMVRILPQKLRFSLPLLHIVHSWFHLHFFTYRSNFFNIFSLIVAIFLTERIT